MTVVREARALILAPAGEAEACRLTLAAAGITGLPCEDLPSLLREVEEGAGVLVLAEEALGEDDMDRLAEATGRQPAWSDLGVILLTAEGSDSPAAEQALERLNNLILLSQPVRAPHLTSAVSSALRSRRRQYQIRDQIAERERQARDLRRSEERLRLSTEAAGIGIWEWDLRTGRQTWDERCKSLFGLRPDAEVSYEVWLNALHHEDRPALQAGTQRIIAGQQEFRKEYRVVWSDGSVHWILARGRTHSKDGQPVRLSGIVMEITAMKEAEETLLEAKAAADAANRAKSEFLANMSHEIRTPLTVTMGTIELLLSTAVTAEQRSFLEMARTSSEALLRLIEDLLDFSRIEAGRMTFRQEPFDLRACLESAVQSFSDEAKRKSLRLSLEIAPDLPGVAHGDSDRLRQVLLNLVGNAIKFTPRGEVAVAVERDTAPTEELEYLLFSVRDTGIGIPGDKMNRLFQTFSQVDSSHTRRYGGTGLGLILSKRLVERMGGSIWVESEPGRGSTFYFRLPLLRDLDRPVVAESPAARWGGAGASVARPVRILLAEDDPMVRDMIEIILHRRQWQVTATADGREAVAAWETGGFDLILMDVQMPGMDGLDASRHIRTAERQQGGHIPIIALTAHARREDRERCRMAGMDDYLAKPIQMEALYNLIERYLGQNQGEREKPNP